jgi:hypothetical protein
VIKMMKIQTITILIVTTFSICLSYQPFTPSIKKNIVKYSPSGVTNEIFSHSVGKKSSLSSLGEPDTTAESNFYRW